jgi:hypothetical protein
VEHREPLLQTIFMLALLVQQASANFLDTPASQVAAGWWLGDGWMVAVSRRAGASACLCSA